MSTRDAVERYLDGLFDYLAGTGAPGRRALAEAEDHLNSLTRDLAASGMPEEAAAELAVARFGDARRIASELRIVHRDLPGLARQLFMTAWLLGGIGAIAVGLSGLLAAAMRAAWGSSFVAGDINGITYTAARCADYVGFFPGHSCTSAAAMHHAGEVILYRAALGIFGLLVLVAWTMSRRTFLRGAQWRINSSAASLLAVTLFGLAAVAFGGQSLVQLIASGPTGVGAYLSAGIVAGLFALTAAANGLRQRTTFADPD